MTAIIFDIETIPSQAPGARDHIRASIKPPGTLKKPESIAAWWKDDSEAAVESEYRKQSLDGGLHGEIISIACCADGHDKTWSYCRKQGEPEADLLTAFFAVVEYWQGETARALLGTHHDQSSAWPMDEPHPVAHNAAFDTPYVWHRARVLGVPVPRWLPSPANLRTLGHSPLGALSVFALLAVVAVQASAGLFTSDDISMEGPLARLVSNALVERASWLHQVNERLILGLVGLHLLAILYYRVVKRQSLVKPMVVGDKLVAPESSMPDPTVYAAKDDAATRWRAVAVAAVAAITATVVVNWPIF